MWEARWLGMNIKIMINDSLSRIAFVFIYVSSYFTMKFNPFYIDN